MDSKITDSGLNYREGLRSKEGFHVKPGMGGPILKINCYRTGSAGTTALLPAFRTLITCKVGNAIIHPVCSSAESIDRTS